MKFIYSLLFILSFSAVAQINSEDALKFVPGGTIIQARKDEVKVRTVKGSVVELEFKRNGTIDDASGDQIENDVFIPGEDQLPLDKIASTLKDQGYQLKGDWSYEKKFMKGWQYEVDAILNNQHLEVSVDAKTGAITDTDFDD